MSSRLGVACSLLLACYLSAPAPLPSPATGVGSSPLRRLSIRELCNTYGELTGEIVTADDFLPEAVPLGFDNGPDLSMVQTDQAARFEEIAWRVATSVTARREPRVLAGCDGVACRDVLVDSFAPRAYRRPLRGGERARLRALWDGTIATASIDATMQTVLAAIFQSPSFLYREEIGAPDAGARRLGPWEIASELSYFVTGNPPDDALALAAASGAIVSPAARRREAERLLATPAGRAQWRTFLREWLALDDLAPTHKQPPDHMSRDLAGAMDDDVNALLDDALSPSGSLARLFTSNVAFVRAPLTDVYGIGPSGFASLADQPSRVELDPKLRGGVLTRPAWLAVHSSAMDSGPIARGVFVLRALLCAPPPAPPSGVAQVAPTTAFTHTTRDRFAAHVSDPTCQSCHSVIDGIGFGFEQFDAIGAWRTTENGFPIDTSGTLDGAPFVGATELSARMLAGEELRTCFTKQMYRFAMGTPEDARTTSALASASKGFTTTSPIESLVVAIAESDLFVLRGGAP
jgi:hypothetical protein